MKKVWKVIVASFIMGILFKPLAGMALHSFPSVTICNVTMFPMQISFSDQGHTINPGETIDVATGQVLTIEVGGISFSIGEDQLDSSLASNWNVALQVIDTSTPFYRALSERLVRPIPVCKYVRLRLYCDSGDCFGDHNQDVIGTAELTSLIALLEGARGK